MKGPEIIVLGGGTSAERDVSLASSRAVHAALEKRYPARWHDLREDALPAGLDPAEHVVFPVLHGTFGEDGGIQTLLEQAGFSYAGCDAASSALCMDKRRAKEAAQLVGVPTPPAVYFDHDRAPSPDFVRDFLGTRRLVVKPLDEGSSVGLSFVASDESLTATMTEITKGRWMIEPHLDGYDVTVGVLGNQALGVVEILPVDGAPYDYAHKYTPGQTEYRYPAPLPEALTEALRTAAVRVFAACGCRDFARVDFFLCENDFTFLEINTIPGLTATSLLPKSARCTGYDFESLVDAMLRPALDRFAAART